MFFPGDEDEGSTPPAGKRPKVSPTDHADSVLPPLYYLTTVRGIPDQYNEHSIGIKGIYTSVCAIRLAN